MKYKKIIILVPYFYPGYRSGGPSKSVFNLAQKLVENGANVEVITLNKDTNNKLYEHHEISSFLNRNDVTFNVNYVKKINLITIFNLVRTNKDSVWVLNSFFHFNFSIFICSILKVFSLNKLTVYLFPRGEFDTGALSIKYRKKSIYIFMSKLFQIYSNIIALGSTEKELNFIRKSKIKFKDYLIQGNIPSEVLFDNREILKLKKESYSKKRIVFASRITKKKNLDFLLNCLELFEEELILDIYGPVRDNEYWEKCKKIISRFDENIQVNYKGEYDPKNLSEVFNSSHWLILPTLGENFGHIIFESVQHGVPVILTEHVTPWDSLLGKNSLFIPLNQTSWVKSLTIINNIKWIDYNSISNNLIDFSKIYIKNNKSYKLFLNETDNTRP
jgi:glycosyltransferase involved in cell wall biosynthesis